jgi:hypothetical protein
MIAIAKTTKFFFFMTKSSRAPDYKWNPRVKFILYKLYPFCYILNRSWFGVKSCFHYRLTGLMQIALLPNQCRAHTLMIFELLLHQLGFRVNRYKPRPISVCTAVPPPGRFYFNGMGITVLKRLVD